MVREGENSGTLSLMLIQILMRLSQRRVLTARAKLMCVLAVDNVIVCHCSSWYTANILLRSN